METIAQALPCKYCRASFSQQIQEDPPVAPFDKWLWKIHNRVNEKLRSQHLPTAPDPSFADVQSIQKERQAAGCTRTQFEGWEFLFSIAECHPRSAASKHSTPMPDAPPLETLKTPLERNRWNLSPVEERMVFYRRFWELLPEVLPYPEWRKAWRECDTDSWETRAGTLENLWKIRCHMETKLELLNKTTYSSLCKELHSHRSGCSKAKRGKTCRKKRQTKQS